MILKKHTKLTKYDKLDAKQLLYGQEHKVGTKTIR